MADESGKPGGDERPSTTYGAAAQSADSKAQSGLVCPKCGVQVAPGYPKCPKCHAAMPSVVSPLAKTSHGGGTSAAAEDNSTTLWFAVGALVLIAGAVVIWQARGDDSDAASAVADALDAGAVIEDDLVEDDEVLATLDAGAPANDAAAYDLALDDLDALLAQRRLWSDVDVEPDADEVVRIDTNMCGEDGLLQAIDEVAPKLTATGFTKVRCYSKHGRLVFEKPLE